MILSVSGRIGSGKDEIGKIIQYLTSESYKKGRDYETFKRKQSGNLDMESYYIPTFEIRKFADKLKDIVCMLIGCTRVKLEDRNFKEKELGEEWNKWSVTLPIGIEYFSSKEEANYFIKNEHPLKRLKSVQNFEPVLVKLTPRLLLQILGTEAGRGLIHPNIWVNSLMSEYKDEHDLSTLGHEAKYPNWVVTDMRFPNEMEAVKKGGGITIRVNRNSVYKDSDTQFSHDIPHPSETSLDNATFDYVIDNNGSIEELIEKVKGILIKENLI